MLCLSFITVSLTASFYVVSHLHVCRIPSTVIKAVTEFTSPFNVGSGVRKEGRQCCMHPVHLSNIKSVYTTCSYFICSKAQRKCCFLTLQSARNYYNNFHYWCQKKSLLPDRAVLVFFAGSQSSSQSTSYIWNLWKEYVLTV